MSATVRPLHSSPRASLEERIADALQSGVASTTISNLIVTAEDAVTIAERAHDHASSKALDPTTRPSDVAEARRDMEDARFNAQRMREASRRLGEALKDAKAREASVRAAEQHAAAAAERDAVAKEIAADYPDLSKRLAALMQRIAHSNEAVAAANRLGVGHLEPAERMVRPLDLDVSHQALPVVELVHVVRLPAFEMIHNTPDLWPPRSRF